MNLKKLKRNFKISTKRFTLKPLTLKDANKNYLSWFSNSNLTFIDDIKNKKINLKYLKEYIQINNKQNKTLFIGIFDKNKNLHIGNLKFYDVNVKKKTCILGIWIGNVKFQNKGVAFEVLSFCISYLISINLIKKFNLGVNNDNEPAKNLYKKLGFKFYKKKNYLNMYLNKENFNKNVKK